MWSDEKCDNKIVLRNVYHLITAEEREKLEEDFANQKIGIDFYETRGMQMSVFDCIYLYLNQNLSELLITGLLAPAAYDLIKSSALFLIKRVKKLLHKVSAKRISEVKPSIQLKCGNAEITAVIPDNLSDEQFYAYMDLLKQTLSEVNEHKFQPLLKYQSFIAEYDANSNYIKVSTITEYGYEQIAKQNECKKIDNK